MRVVARVLVVLVLGAGLVVVPPSGLPVVVAADPVTYADEVLADSPLAYWRLEETSGSSAADSSGNGNGATFGSVVVRGSAGLIRGVDGAPTGSSVTFPGSGSTNRITTPVNLGGVGAFSVEAWVSRETSGHDHVMSIGSHGYLSFGNTAPLNFVVAGGQVSYSFANYMSALTTYHVVGTWDGSTARLYVNGVEVGSAAATGAVTSGVTEIGSSGLPFKGSMDEIAIYDSALAPSRVVAHWAKGWQGPAPAGNAYSEVVQADDPEAYWPLDESGSPSRVMDGSGNGRHGRVLSGVALGAGGLVRDAGGSVTGSAMEISALSGSSNRVVAPMDLRGATAMTFEAWVSRNTYSHDTIVDLGTDGRLKFSNVSPLEWIIAGATVTTPWSLAMSANVAYHVAGTWDGSTARLYVNGVEVGAAASTASSLAGSADMTIGSRAGGGDPFRGRIDEVAVYREALGAERIRARWLAGNRGPVPTHNVSAALIRSLGPLAHWQFDEAASAGRALDVTGNGYHGAVLANVVTGDTQPGGVSPRYRFDPVGTTDAASRVVAPLNFRGFGAFTVSVEVDRTVHSHDTVFAQNGGPYLAYGNTSPITFGVGANRSTYSCVCAGPSHWTMTWDGSTIRLYQGVAQVASMPWAGTIAASGDFSIGANMDGANAHKGIIDEVVAFDRALSPEEIEELVTAGPPPDPIRPEEQFGGCGCAQETTADAADPVDTWSGNFWHRFEDLSVPGRGPALSVTRTYNSLDADRDGAFGHGWTYSYGAELVIDTGTVTVHQPSGAQAEFTLAGGAWTAAPRVQATLVHNGDGTWTFTRRQQEIFTFDATGRLTAVEDLNGEATTIDHVSAASQVITDPAGRDLDVTLAGGRIVEVADEAGRTVTYAYDAAGDLVEVVDVAGGTTTFTYDDEHRLVTWRTPRFDASTATPAPVVTNDYDTEGRVVAQTDPTGAVTTFDYTTVPGSTLVTDPEGNQTLHVYAFGLLVETVTGYGTTQAARWTYGYDPETTARTVVTDPAGRSTRSTYNTQGLPLTVTDPLGRVTTMTYNGLGLPLSVTDPAGVTTTNTYDTAGNLTATSTPLVGSSPAVSRTVTFTYADGAHPGDVTAMTDPRGEDWTYGYDPDGNLTSVTDPLGNQARSCFDDIGRLTRSITAVGVDAGETCATATPQHSTVITRNAFGDPLTVTDPLGGVSTMTYDPNRNLTSLEDPTGDITTYAYDPADRLVEVTRADDSTLVYGHDANGNRTTVTDGAANTTTYAYSDPAHPRAVTAVTDPLGRVTASIYDRSGRLRSTVEPGGACGSSPSGCTTYGYDPAGQLTSVDYTDPATPDVTDIAYDPAGRRVAMTDSAAMTLTWAYDSLGRVTASGDGTVTTSYGYDLAANLTSLTYPGSGQTVTRGYDAAGRMTTSTDWASNTTSFDYDPDGRLVEVLYPTGGQVDAYGYDRAGRMESVTMTAGAATLADIAYTRDPAGRLTGEDHSGLPGPDRTWDHDDLGRLSDQDTTPTWAYDDADNLTATTGGTAQVFDAANQLCAAGATAGTCAAPASGATVFDYDNAGNRLSAEPAAGPTLTYGWDDAHRLTTLDDGATTWTHRWRPDGLLAGTDDTATATGLVWSQHGGLPQPLAETTPTGATSWLYGPDGAAYAQVDPTGAVTYLHRDQLGSTRLVSDPTGAVTATVSYDPYGTVAASTGTAPRLGFAGAYTDPAGLIYLRARHYDPVTGQFLSRDPLQTLTGQPYAYANNNPLVYTDPTGLIFGAITDAVGDAFDSAVGAVGDAWDATAGRGVTAINDTCFGSWQAAATCTAVVAGGVALGAGGLAALGLAGGLSGTLGTVSTVASALSTVSQGLLTYVDCRSGLDASCLANIASTVCGAGGTGLGAGASFLDDAGSLMAGPAAGYGLGISSAGGVLGWPGFGGYLNRNDR